MTRQRPFRIAVVNAISLMLMVGLLAGPASAKAPTSNLSDTWEASPDVVSAGGLVRFDVHITNDSSSNYSSFYVDAATPNGATLVAWFGESQGTCDGSSGDLSCDFGAVNGGVTVDFTTIYQVPSSASGSFSVTYIATSNGNTSSDKPGQSHGDDYVVVATVDIGSGDSGGSYIYGDVLSTQDDQDLNRHNPQSSKLVFTSAGETGFPATVMEDDPIAYACPTNTGLGALVCFGQWSVISVADGGTVEGGIEVTIGYDRISGNANDVGFVHLPDGGGYELIGSYNMGVNGDLCGPDPVDICASYVTQVQHTQGDYYFTFVLSQNGPLRGW
jgi:hypothetical protein